MICFCLWSVQKFLEQGAKSSIHKRKKKINQIILKLRTALSKGSRKKSKVKILTERRCLEYMHQANNFNLEHVNISYKLITESQIIQQKNVQKT